MLTFGALPDLEFMVFRFAVVYAGIGVGFPALMLLLKVFVTALKELSDTSVVRSEA